MFTTTDTILGFPIPPASGAEVRLEGVSGVAVGYRVTHLLSGSVNDRISLR